MTRARRASATLTAAVLAAAVALWMQLPDLIRAAGLQRYDLLARVLLVFAALSVTETLVTRIAARLSAGPQGQTKDDPDEH